MAAFKNKNVKKVPKSVPETNNKVESEESHESEVDVSPAKSDRFLSKIDNPEDGEVGSDLVDELAKVAND